MENILIRRAGEGDLKIVQEFGFKLLDYERRNWDASLDPEWPFSEIGKRKYLEAIREKYTLIAENDGEAVGFLIGKIIEMPTDSARQINQARLENIYVDEDVRGGGVGAKLLENFRDFCRKNNVERLDVSVLADNDVAIKFYEEMGFRPRSLNLSQEL